MIKLIKKQKGRKKEAGFTLIAAIIFMMLIGFLGVTASFLFTSGTTTTKDYLLSARVFSVAEGGLARGIRKYLENSAYSGESSSLTLGSQSYPFTTSVFPTDFSGNPLPANANQLRIHSSCSFQSVQRVVEQIVQRQSVFSQSTYTSYVPYAITSQGNIIVGGTTYISCPGTTGCLTYLRTNQPMAPITVSGGLNSTNPSLVRGNTYNYNNVNITSSLSLTGSGSNGVTVYCKQLTVGTGASISVNGGSGNPDNLLFIVQGNVSISNNVTFKGAIYAPNGSITILNSFTLTGGIAGNSVSIGTSSSITFDSGAGSSTPDPTNGYNQTAIISEVASGWQEVFQ